MKYQSQLGNIEKRRKNKVAKLASEEASLVNWQQRLADVQERVSFVGQMCLCHTTLVSRRCILLISKRPTTVSESVRCQGRAIAFQIGYIHCIDSLEEGLCIRVFVCLKYIESDV